MEKKFFVTAIGTDSGKTVVSAILAQALQADYWKPVQAGRPADSNAVKTLTEGRIKIHPERFFLNTPASPHLAASIDNIKIQLEDFELPESERLVVEGAGGMMVPLNDHDLVIDLAEKWNLPIILVCNIYLGSINHSLLSIAYLKQRGLKVAGIIFNGPETPSTESIIEKNSPWPVLFKLRPLKTVTAEKISEIAVELADRFRNLE